ncbi:MAG TPA: hypothetical protein PKW33_21320 [Anaerolineaceae bacterium]|nr:hypothetical protein [Anaerolineaceae bacterium]HPN54149.1 hypothetical protein [Anaerolineaceae bacterium]
MTKKHLLLRPAAFWFCLLGLTALSCTLSGAPTPASWSLTSTVVAQSQTAEAINLSIQQTAAAAPTLPPTSTPTPVPPTLTPTPSRLDSGPWALVSAGFGSALWLFNPQADAFNTAALPGRLLPGSLPGSQPAVGSIMALRTKSDAPLTYTLSLLSLPGLTLSPVADLLGPRLQKLATQPETISDTLAALEQPGAVSWSPNGQKLAFIGAQDGLSTDLYIYDRRTKEILRLTTGPYEVSAPIWSPDGQWVVTSEMEQTNGRWQIREVWAFSIYSKEARRLYTPPENSQAEHFLAWLNNNTLLTCSEGAENLFSLREVRLDRPDARERLAGPFEEVVIDPQSQTLLYVQLSGSLSGLYLMPPGGGEPRLLAGGWWRSLRWDAEGQVFRARNSTGTIWVELDGDIFMMEMEDHCEFSPPHNWLICWGGKKDLQPGLRLYQVSGTFIQHITKQPIDAVLWNKDGLSWFFLSEGTLNITRFPALNSQVLSTELQTGDYPALIWVQ